MPDAIEELPPTFTPSKLAKYLNCSADKVWHLIAVKRIMAHNTAIKKSARRPRWIITREEVERYLRSISTATPPAKTARSRKLKPESEFF